jgi:hypothetical protein
MTVIGSNDSYKYSKLLVDTYRDPVIETINIPQILSILEQLNYPNAKVLVSGKHILEKSNSIFGSCDGC